MTKRILFSFPLLLICGLAAALAAQQGPESQGQEAGRRGAGGPPPVMGTITSVGVDRFEIKNPDGAAQAVMVSDQTRYRQRQEGQQPQELQLEDLKVGDHVFVRGAPNADQPVVAMGVFRVTAEQFARFQSGGGPGGPGPGGQTEATRAFGEITSISGNQIKVQSRRSGERVIVVTDQTTFTKQGQSIGLKDLKVGDRIFAMGKEVNGQFTATEVHCGRPGGGGGRSQGQPQN